MTSLKRAKQRSTLVKARLPKPIVISRISVQNLCHKFEVLCCKVSSIKQQIFWLNFGSLILFICHKMKCFTTLQTPKREKVEFMRKDEFSNFVSQFSSRIIATDSNYFQLNRCASHSYFLNYLSHILNTYFSYVESAKRLCGKEHYANVLSYLIFTARYRQTHKVLKSRKDFIHNSNF